MGFMPAEKLHGGYIYAAIGQIPNFLEADHVNHIRITSNL